MLPARHAPAGRDDLEELPVEELGEAQGGELFQRYGDAPPVRLCAHRAGALGARLYRPHRGSRRMPTGSASASTARSRPDRGCCARSSPGLARLTMIVGVPRESYPGERRVALVPAVDPEPAESGPAGHRGGGSRRGGRLSGQDYASEGAKVVPGRADVFRPPASSSRFSATARTTGPVKRPAALASRPVPGRIFAALGADRDPPADRRHRRYFFRRRTDAADDARAEHGRALLDGNDLRLQGRGDCG